MIPYIITILVYLSFNLTIYNYYLYIQEEKDKSILQGYLNSISNLLLQDLSVALNKSNSSKGFLLFKRSTNIDKNIEPIITQTKLTNIISIKPYVINIQNLSEEIILDLQELKENLNNIFPSYISYSITINDHNIAFRKDYKQTFNVTDDYNIDSNTLLSIKLGIKKDSSFYLSNKLVLHTNTFITTIISFFIGISLLYSYLRIKTRIEDKFNLLEHNLSEATKINVALQSNRKVNQFLQKLFIKKVTEMYIKQEIGMTSKNKKIIDQILPNKYLFPMCLTDSSPEKIDITYLMKMLKEYFAPYFTTIALKMTTTVNTININCTTAVFYQLIFSLISNLIEFMDKQSDVPKAMTIGFTAQQVIINYDSFPLDEKRMIDLSETLILTHIDVFLLSCNKIFRSLKDHKFKYTISSNNGRNTVIIIYPIKIEMNNDKGQIIDFTKYLN